ncbi:MAG: hypothetical protein HC844_03895 [Tabrizicola sp.]|nr:hypothetical protein [Tabrizicola sp.]
MTRIWRVSLLVLILVSAGLTYRSAVAILENPALTPLVQRSTEEIIAATDLLMAREATPERLADRLATRLDERPRNWVALERSQSFMRNAGFRCPRLCRRA